MNLNKAVLFTAPALIWGSTWFAIKFQLGDVPPAWSVAYRFYLASTLLFIYCGVRGISLKFDLQKHLRMAMQGCLLFGINYWLAYLAELELTSALMSVAFGTIIFMNMLFGKLFLGNGIQGKVLFGAIMGIFGTFLIFFQDLKDTTWESLPMISIVFAFGSVGVASLGNITSAANQKFDIPVISSNAFGMLYGALLMSAVALTTGTLPTFDFSTAYLSSLVYLSLFGSIIAFTSYLTLVGQIGPTKASYVLVVIPAVSLVISTLYEGFIFSWYAIGGVILILMGNVIVLRK
ncbi:MAG: EamA family transporter [Cyclobacteriaceae bacterium]